MSGTVNTQDQTFITSDIQLKTAELAIDQLAINNSSLVTVAELGRWYAVDNTRLLAQDNTAAAAAGVTVPTTLTAAQGSLVSALSSLSGTAFTNTYLADVISLKTQETVGGAAEISSGSNAVFQQIATASNGLVAEQLNDAQHVQASVSGGTAVAIGNSMPFAGPAPAANGTLNAQDQTFITALTQGALTAQQEAGLAITNSPDLSVQTYGVWNRCENAQAQVNVQALAQAEGGIVPTTLTAAQAMQVSALTSLTGTAFESAYTADQISNDQVLRSVLAAEVSGGSDPALVALAQLITTPAQGLLTQGVIETTQIGASISGTALAPNTTAGSLVSNLATAAASGSLTIGNVSTGPAPLSGGATGLLLDDVANSSTVLPAGYTDVLDVAGGPVTVSATANTTNLLVGGTSGFTYYGATGSGGTALLTGGNSLLEGTSTGAGNFTVIATGGANTIFAGSGSDQIATLGGTNLIGLGSGSNVLTSSGTDTVLASSGTNLIFGAGGGQTVFGGTGGTTFVGGANDSATLITGSAPVQAFASSGGTINLFGAASGNVLVAGGGNETLQGGSATGNTTFFGGSGTAALLGGAGNDTFVAGKGGAAMTGSGGSNLFVFVAGGTGGATDTITDFGANAGNKVQVTGYGQSAQTLLSTASVSGGNTTVTLSDNTKVQFLGVSNLGTASFSSVS